MTAADQRKWIVRDINGKIFGPFSTEDLNAQIDRAYIVGSEQIAVYPEGRWAPISNSSEFSDRILDALANEARPSSQKSATQAETSHQNDSDDEPTKPPVPQDLQPPPITQASRATLSVATSPAAPQTPTLKGPVIELTDLRQAVEEPEEDPPSNFPIYLIVAALVLFGAALLWPQEKAKKEDSRIHLLMPRKGQTEMAEATSKEKFRRALVSFQSDVFSGYQKAQNELVEIVESAPSNPESAQKVAEWYAMLCMTYRELWPFSYQDSVDMRAVSSAMQQAKALDPGGGSGATCEIVQLLLSGHMNEAQRLTETHLQEDAQTAILFEIRGQLFASVGDESNAATYFNQARTLWPGWLKISVEEAHAQTAQNQFPRAIELYKEVLQQNPKHAVTKIEVGLIELNQFGHEDSALQYLSAGLDGSEKIPRTTEATGDFAVARIYERKNQKGKALEFAKKAYALNSSNLEAQGMIIRLAGAGALGKSKSEGGELVYLGDQYRQAGDCFSAQAQYKAAFESEPTNGSAAMKAGQCLWELNQSNEAIEWLRKAIQADPRLVQAYTTLADYYAQRYDYTAATQTLARIQRLQPNSYEVYRGLATVELQRNNYQGAATYALRALKLYETDHESFVVMAKAQLGLQNYQEAQRYVNKALELDSADIDAQTLNGKVIAGVSGVDAGAEYLRAIIARILVNKGQSVPPAAIDLRVALGDIYMQDERYAAAEEAYRQALSLDPRRKKTLVALGKVLQKENEQPQALESFLQAAVLDPSDADAIFLSGQLYADVGKLPEAAKQFERVLKINSRYPRAHTELGRVALRQGDAKTALEQAMQERAMNPELTDTYELAADSYFSLKQYSNCAAEYQRGSRHHRTAELLVRMARCYRLSGALDSAQSLLRQAQSMESGNPNLYKEQGAIFHMKGMADEAVTAYSTYLNLMPNAPDRAEIESRIQRVQKGDMTVGE
jgi:tetratricopeptide (TPR) repeat protein